MAEFISTFTTGFQDIICDDLPRQIRGCKIVQIYDGLVHYSYNGNSRDLEKIPYFNNTFFVLATMKGGKISFDDIMNSVATNTKYYLVNKGSVRIKFVKENQFTHVDLKTLNRAERIVLSNSKLKINHLDPSTEIWYSIRREGFGFCGQLISKRTFTEKNLHPGELRPEIAYLICCFADISDQDIIIDPFCGYGAIPMQLATHFKYKKLIASDLDKNKITIVKSKKQIANNNNTAVFVQDALVLDKIPDKYVDTIITDPPWGFYEKIDNIIDFYEKMFNAMRRIIKDDGTIIILSARKQELEIAAHQTGFKTKAKIHTLVNGKKASLYKFYI